jgi:Predicted permeases
MIETVFLLVAGFLGGAVNSLAGGGSFIVFPALLFVGVPPVLANASNTYAALPGYVSGVAGYWQSMMKYRDRLLVLWACRRCWPMPRTPMPPCPAM